MELGTGGTAFFWGIVSAVSLPLGAFLGLWLKPKRKMNSALMAFGAGALLFALTIELFGHVPHYFKSHGWPAVWAAVIGAVAGGLLFDGLNNILNNKGAFLRRLSAARKYVARLKARRTRALVVELCKVDILKDLPPDALVKLARGAEFRQVKAGEKLFSQGDEAHEMFFILKGKIEINFHENGHMKTISTLGKYETFGELGILSGYPRSADALAQEDTILYALHEDDLQKLMREYDSVQNSITKLASTRVDEFSMKSESGIDSKWREEVMGHCETASIAVTNEEIRKEGEHSSHGNAAMAIWLGILIDSIPESLVLGMLAVSATGMSYAFVAGVFLANLPEAMSSAVSMRMNGMSLPKIYLMWGSICLFTGLGAVIGAVGFPADPVGTMFYVVVGIEALAAGAMLTMIAETMLPEAFEQGGSIVGLSTLGGFLAALLVKMF